MPENANENALTTSDGATTETTAGKPSPTALPTVEEENAKLRQVLARLVEACRGYPCRRSETFVSTFDDEWEAQFAEFSGAWQAAQEVLRPPAPDSTRKRDGVAGDVQPLRPRE